MILDTTSPQRTADGGQEVILCCFQLIELLKSGKKLELLSSLESSDT